MSPLKDLEAGGIRDKEMVGQPITQVGLAALGLSNQ